MADEHQQSEPSDDQDHACEDPDCPKRENPLAECSVRRRERLRSIISPVRGQVENAPEVEGIAKPRKLARRNAITESRGVSIPAESGLEEAAPYLLRETERRGRQPVNPRPRAVLDAAALLRSLTALVEDLEGVSRPGDRPSETLRRLRHDLRAAGNHIAEEWGAEEEETGPLERQLDALIEAALAAEEFVEDQGLEYDFENRRLKVPAGPETEKFYTAVVRALLKVWKNRGEPVENTRKTRRWLAEEMAPFFSADRLSIERGDELHYTVKNLLS